MSVIYFPTQNQPGNVEKLLSKIVPTFNPVIMVDLNKFFSLGRICLSMNC